MSVTCVCMYDKEIVVNPRIFTYCTPVLARFFGLGEFAPPNRDEQGRLTFLRDLEIERRHFVPIISFLRSGYVDDIDYLMHTMNILGGCDALDAHYLKLKKDEKEEKAAKLMNPKDPSEDKLGIYEFRAMEHNWCRDGTWQITKKIDGTALYWWRHGVRRTVEEIEEEDVLSE